MNLRQVINFIAAEPFQPFRVRMSDGRTFDVLFPDDAATGIEMVRVFATVDNESGAHEQWHKIPMNLIECIEPMHVANRSPLDRCCTGKTMARNNVAVE